MADTHENIASPLNDQAKEPIITPRTEDLSRSRDSASTDSAVNEIQASTQTFDSDAEKQAEALVASSLTSQKLHKFDEALPGFHAALKIYIKLYGHDHKVVASTLNSLGNCFFDAERYEEALAKYQEALDVCKASTGDVSVETANVYQNMSRVLFKLERFQEALDMNSEAMGIKNQIPTTSSMVASDKPTKKFVSKKKEKKCTVQ